MKRCNDSFSNNNHFFFIFLTLCCIKISKKLFFLNINNLYLILSLEDCQRAWNALLLIRCFCKYMVNNLPEQELIRQFNTLPSCEGEGLHHAFLFVYLKALIPDESPWLPQLSLVHYTMSYCISNQRRLILIDLSIINGLQSENLLFTLTVDWRDKVPLKAISYLAYVNQKLSNQ